jgi:SAM-dependent methyltransferase
MTENDDRAANATIFGTAAKQYRAARPGYPPALFDWVAAQAPGRDLAWDVGTGNGQAAHALAERFDQVHATDIDPRQLAEAPDAANITYYAAPAHESGLEEAACDAVVVATALHWFDFQRFWPEVARVAKPGALFAAWSHSVPIVDPELEARLLNPVRALVAPYWSAGNALAFKGYPPDEIGLPFEPVDTPAFEVRLDWSPRQFAQFLRSWSAYRRAAEDGLGPELDGIEAETIAALGTTPRPIRLPLAVRAATIRPGAVT